jgi:hypothetical protein
MLDLLNLMLIFSKVLIYADELAILNSFTVLRVMGHCWREFQFLMLDPFLCFSALAA